MVKYYATDYAENITTGDDDINSSYYEFKLNIDKIYVDLTGPTLEHSISGDKFKTRDTVFIGPKAKIELYASDYESGMNYIAYSIDGNRKEIKYNSSFSIDANSGLHQIEYFGYDNVNNRNIEQFFILLDNDGPEIKTVFSILSLGIKDSLEIFPDFAAMYVSAQDELTGVSSIYYSLNGKRMTQLKGKITGFKRKQINSVLIKAYDKLNNETIKEFKFYVE